MTAVARPAGAPANPPQRSATRFAPLLVLAPARSLSSLVVAMLGQHPQLYGFPELRLFRAERVGGLLAEPAPGTGMPAKERASGLVRALAQTREGTQSAAAVERAWQWLAERVDWDVALVFDHLLAQVEPLVGVEKSPESTLTHESLARAAAAYPAARYVHLVRHPWATVASMKTAWQRLSYWPVPPERAAQFCAELWLEQHGRIAAFGEQLGPDRLIRLRAEDVVNRVEVLRWLCRWLAISDGEECVAEMRRPERSPYACWGPASATGGFDPLFLDRPWRRDVALPTSLAAPASWRLNPGTHAEVIRLASRFGYEGPGQHEAVSAGGRLAGSAVSRSRAIPFGRRYA